MNEKDDKQKITMKNRNDSVPAKNNTKNSFVNRWTKMHGN